MSAAEALTAAVVAVLRAEASLVELGVFDAPPVRAFMPHAVVEDPVLAAFDAAGVTGRVGTIAIGFRDQGEVPARLRGLMAIAEQAVDAMPDALAGGWRIGGLMLARSRLMWTKDGWSGRAEWAVRLFRVS